MNKIVEQSIDPPEYEVPHCPLCGEEANKIFRDKMSGDIYGCENCVEEIDSWEFVKNGR